MKTNHRAIVLLDAVLLKTLHPEDFNQKFPSLKQKTEVAPGDACKVGIRHHQKRWGEILWVNVTSIATLQNGERWFGGFLHDTPSKKPLNAILKEGDFVSFRKEHIFEIVKEAHDLWEPHAKSVVRGNR